MHAVLSVVDGWPRPSRITTVSGGPAAVSVMSNVPFWSVVKLFLSWPLTATVPENVFVVRGGSTTVGWSAVLAPALDWHAWLTPAAASSAAIETADMRARTEDRISFRIIRRAGKPKKRTCYSLHS